MSQLRQSTPPTHENRADEAGRRGARAGFARGLVVAFVVFGLGAAGCGEDDSPAPTDVTDAAADGAEVGEADAADANLAPRCRPGPGASGRPRSIEEVVQLVNSLPAPVGIDCFLQSLDRPLGVAATRSLTSLQPSVGVRSPRMFLFSGPLVMSIVPEGKGSRLVEFGQFVGEARTLKGELAFPIAGLISPAEAFKGIRNGSGTTCRVCHASEERAVDIGYAEAFISRALRPQDRQLVDLETVRRERAICDARVEPDRCAFLRALFDHGEVSEQNFDRTVPTIFD